MPDVDLETLLTQRADLDAQVDAAHQAALDELVAAKDAHRADPNPDTEARKAAAVEAITRIRKHLRADRTGVAVAGDAFTVNGNEG